MSTEPVQLAIAAALYAKLITPELTNPATPRAAPLVAYTPTTGTAYMEVHPLLRAHPEHFGIDYANSDILRGIFQVDIVVPDGAGENPGVRLASLVVARFPIGLLLTVVSTLGTRALRITNTPTIAAAVKDAPWVRFPVSILYQIIT